MEVKRNPAPWKSAQGQSSQELGDSLDFCISYTVGRGFSYAPGPLQTAGPFGWRCGHITTPWERVGRGKISLVVPTDLTLDE